MKKNRIVFNQKTGEFEEGKKRRGCGCAIAIVVVLAILVFLYLNFIA